MTWKPAASGRWRTTTARYNFIKLDQRLRRHITFANHNLVTDEVFCKAHRVLCRNVLIHFSEPLPRRTLTLLHDNLVRGGHLCLGLRESPDFAPAAAGFSAMDGALRLYRRGKRHALIAPAVMA